MRVEEVRKIARGMGTRLGRMKKAELIHRIQRAEGNIPCFGTDRVGACEEMGCLWREDCIKLDKKRGE